MPILPENRALYPNNWQEIRAEILEREGNACKFCKIPNYEIRPDTESKETAVFQREPFYSMGLLV